MIKEKEENGLKKLIIENEKIEIILLPEIGGKMISLKNKKTDKQFLLEPQNNPPRYIKPFYGADFTQFDTSGFDECFPNISEVNNLKDFSSGETINLPDHGELWSKSWDYNILDEKSIELFVQGVNLNYLFTKKIELDDNKIFIFYTVKNLSIQDIKFIWSAHPLLKCNSGDKILLPQSVKNVLLNWASDEKLGKFSDYLNWPFLSKFDTKRDYSIVQNFELGQAMKLFTDRLNEGYAGLYFIQDDESIFFSFNTNEVTYLGLWLCYGGWPTNVEKKHYTLAIEPSIGRPDSLAEAIKRNENGLVKAFENIQWQVEISMWKGKPEKNLLIENYIKETL